MSRVCLCPQGSLFGGGSLSRGISVQGISVWGSPKSEKWAVRILRECFLAISFFKEIGTVKLVVPTLEG